MSTSCGETEASRREFLCALAGCAAAALGSCSEITHTPFFTKRFRELGEDERKAWLADLERRQAERHGRRIEISDRGPKPGVEFGYALDLSRCVGCRRCALPRSCLRWSWRTAPAHVDGRLEVGDVGERPAPRLAPCRRRGRSLRRLLGEERACDRKRGARKYR